jgi:opacity protein-like surface antigen
MKIKILLLFLLFSSFAFSQTSKFSIEAGYPLPIDNNFLGDHFKGIADVGLKYRIKNLQVINIGLSLNGSMFTYSDSGYFPAFDENLSFKTTLYMIQPRFYTELNLKKVIKIHPFIGLGYSFLLADRKFDSQSQIPNDSINQSGININIGISYDVFSKVYLFTSYDYITLSNIDSGVPKTTYNTKVNLLKIGVGIRL